MTAPGLETLASGFFFPECPRWHAGSWWLSDFYGHCVVRVDATGAQNPVATVTGRPAGLGWLPDGRLLVASMLDRAVLALEEGGPVAFADLHSMTGGPCNDLLATEDGTVYVGNFGFDRHAGEDPAPTCLIEIDRTGQARVAAEDVWFPNGMTVSPDGSLLVVAETFARRLSAWDRSPGGDLTNRRVWAQSDDLWPDGICMDAEGAIWVADPRAGAVLRMQEGGRVLQRVTPPDGCPYACVLGGPQRRTLAVCTARLSGPAAASERSGALQTTEVKVPGAGLP